jgi:hypothetical protein
MVFAACRLRQLFTQMADKDVDDLELRLVPASRTVALNLANSRQKIDRMS